MTVILFKLLLAWSVYLLAGSCAGHRLQVSGFFQTCIEHDGLHHRHELVVVVWLKAPAAASLLHPRTSIASYSSNALVLRQAEL